ncbi:hypothetical protein SAMN05880592_1394 [Bosea sp. TND4EK4]|nr:hypothetical protein SAMN05880592_1394 [Bosea sp. TND4EK4]
MCHDDQAADEDEAGPRSRRAWRCYCRLGSVYLLTYVVVFNLTSWIAALRRSKVSLYLPPELGIAFSPVWIWPYASLLLVIVVPALFLGEIRLKRLGQQSMAVLIVASACFVLFPAELGFTRSLPDEAPYRQIFTWLFAMDRPNNLVPSLHVALSTLCIVAFAEAIVSPVGRFALWVWLGMIAAATVLVHQHHLLDVASGFALACGVRRWLPLSSGSAGKARRFPEGAVVQDQEIDIRGQENANGILDVVNHRPAHHIEAGVE